jgi:hypothetical protein
MSLSKLPESVTLRLADDLPICWDPSPKNKLLPSNASRLPIVRLAIATLRNAMLGCDTEIVYVTVMGVVLTLTDFRLRLVETRLKEHQQHLRQTSQQWQGVLQRGALCPSSGQYDSPTKTLSPTT